MTNIVLPKLSQGGANEWADVEDNDVAIRDVVNGELDNNNLSGSAGITRANLATESKPVRWYTPKIIATEESRENTAYGTLTTADEIKEVELATNGLIVIGYMALWKNSSATNGRAAIFIGSNQLKADLAGEEAEAQETSAFTTFHLLGSYAKGLKSTSSSSFTGTLPTTGMAIGPVVSDVEGGMCFVFAAAGTYNISVKYKASSGSVTAKERKLWVATLG